MVLVSANLYLQALAGRARTETARAQMQTAETVFQQASNMKENGLVAGIDVVRADVQLSTERQRVTAAQNDYEKTKLQLARVIGLPLGQAFELVRGPSLRAGPRHDARRGARPRLSVAS